ncbi:MAG TPA: hypothetical protein VG842_00770, partial [Sediminibacterium sp.]|nr:hypothetical protein [Sediminibacterium sp.]
GKTGTTNDNSDAWFIGYTPQLLAGGWVGCDDRFIRFNTESHNGEGGRAAMPIWAYFMDKAVADPNCGMDINATFVKPDIMTNDIIIDYSGASNQLLNGEEEDMGTGTSQQYEVPKNIRIEDIAPESDSSTLGLPPKPPANPGSKEKEPKKPDATTPPPVNEKGAKALMPPKKSRGGQ